MRRHSEPRGHLGVRRATVGAVALAVAAGMTLAVTVVPAPQSRAGTGHPEVITVDGRDAGKVFDGVGAVSAGGSSRLLVDYAEPERSQILDYLFKPGYGASLQMLKVEIGGDVDATDGAEPSHEREPGEVRCDRGYEWWLAKQAKERNPDLRLYALAWGAPGWFDGGLWSKDYVHYLVNWLDCAKTHGLTIDYLGGANERGYDRDFYVALRAGLDANGYRDVKVVASDEHHPPDYYAVAHDLRDDQKFADAVDVLGEHDVCVWRTLQRHCHANDDARALSEPSDGKPGKPLWDSENSTQDFDIGAGPLARAMNRHYLDAGITGNLNWALLAAWYDSYPIGGTGLMTAERPWSGSYEVGPEIWVDAQTTQFTEPGWRYLDGASGYLDSGASYVSLRSPDTDDYTTVVETMDATAPETVRVSVTGGLSTGPVSVWSTDVATRTTGDDFVEGATIRPENGTYTLTLRPGHVYTLSTTTGQSKGGARPQADPGEQLPLPYREDFEGLEPGRLAPYVSDVNGGFETAPCAGDRDGMCYRQLVTREPIDWHGVAIPPLTLTGDPRWWGDYEVSADALLEEKGYVELLGRVDSQQHHAAGYHLRISDTGAWSLTTEDVGGESTALASGTVDPLGTGTWHHLSLHFEGERITARLDGEALTTVRDATHTTGQVGFSVSRWKHAQFDNLAVTPTGRAPRLVPHAQMDARATSAHAANDGGHSYPAMHAIDDELWSLWRSEYDPVASLPQGLTLDLGHTRPVHGVVYTPGVTAGTAPITSYELQLSRDGKHFTTVHEGHWQDTHATKTAALARAHPARYVRLVGTGVRGCPATAAVAELNVATTPLAALGTGEPGGGTGPEFPARVPQDQMSATATSAEPGYGPAQAIDGNCATLWHTRFGAADPPPQSITLDLGKAYDTVGLAYQPRQDGNPNGVVTAYKVEISTDGETFTPVADGSWAADDATKSARWDPAQARYLRLTGVEGVGDFVSAAELQVGIRG